MAKSNARLVAELIRTASTGGVSAYTLINDPDASFTLEDTYTIVPNNFTPTGTWQLFSGNENAVLHVSDLDSVANDSGDNVKVDTTVSNDLVFYQYLYVSAGKTLTVPSGEVVQGHGDTSPAAVGVAAVGVADGFRSVQQLMMLGVM